MMAQIFNELPSARNRSMTERQWHPELLRAVSDPPAATNVPSWANIGSV